VKAFWIFPLFWLLPALAQEASISGVITDASGAALPAVTVTVKNVETGSVRTLATDNAGRYTAASVQVGRYEVTAGKEGFTSAQKTGISLVIGEQSTVNFALEVGELRQIITVEETPSAVNLSTEQIGGLVGEREVKDLPLNGRSYDELLTLNPGVVNYTSERSGGVGASTAAVGNMFAVLGRRPQENLFLLNGVEYTSASQINTTPGGASGQLLGVEAVREFNVLTGAYGAQYGKRPGAQVSIVTASGTNALHGSVYEFLRNSVLDARNFFDQGSIPQFERNVFGVALGGPIKKDKTFLFANFEGFRQHLGLSDVTLVPDANARSGYLPDSSGNPVFNGITPRAAALLALWPVANGPDLGAGVAEAFSNPIQAIHENFGTARLDHSFSDSDSLAAIYTVDDSADTTPSANPLTVLLEGLREQVVSLQETHIFSSRTLNTARVGFSRGSYAFDSETLVNVPGFVEGAPVGSIVIGGSTASNAASAITGAGTNVGSNLLAARNLFTFEDHVDYTKGIHRLEAGAWLQRIQANDLMAQAQYGQASFSSLATFLQGTISTFTAVPTPTPLGWRSLEGAGYAQDTLKPWKNLEIQIGFRFESTDGWNEAHGRAANYLFDANGVIETNPVVGSSAFTVNHAKFLPEPRAGLAWSPFGTGKTVVRAGFGIYYALLDNLSYRMDQNPPFNTTISIKNASLATLDIVPGAPLPAGGLISPAGFQPDLKTPQIASYTFHIEQEIASGTSLALGYVGSRGRHEILSLDANEPAPTICPASPCPAGLATGTIYYPKNAPLANPNLANTTSWFSTGDSAYNAVQADLNHRFERGLQFRAVYTFSKSLDDGATLASAVGTNAPAFVMFPSDPHLDWGLSTFNVRQSVSVNASYELPLTRHTKGIAGKLGAGWTASSIVSAETGFPFTPQLGFNPSNNGDTRNPVRPSWNPAFSGPVVLGGPNQYFNANAFIAPVNGTYGNVGRDVLIGPGLSTVDFSMAKSTPLSERLKLQFRAEFFNILNHPNFNTPNPVVISSATSGPAPTAGVITSTSATSRQVQFGLKLLF